MFTTIAIYIFKNALTIFVENVIQLQPNLLFQPQFKSFLPTQLMDASTFIQCIIELVPPPLFLLYI